MKKTILTTALALGLTATGVSTSNLTANAAEQNTINQADLANLALNHAQVLNDAPIQQGAYDYSFVYNGYQFDFESDGAYWTWEYKATNAANTAAPVSAAVQTAVKAPVAAPAAPAQTAVATTNNTTTYKAPAAVQTTAVKTATKTATTQTSAVSNNSGLNWAALAQCEAGGNASINTGNGFYGLYQFDLQTWQSVGGTGLPSNASAAEQTKRAQILYNQRGSQPWPVCGAQL